MNEYQKIQTIFHRDPETNNKTLIEGAWSHPAFEYLKDNQWLFTEKIDGTNIRVVFDGERIIFKGKSENAQMPPALLERLEYLFPLKKFTDLEYSPLTLYGEGYGRKIQSGGGYISDGVDFMLFDVLIDKWWLERENIEDIASKLGINAVPIISSGTLLDGYELTRAGFKSRIADRPAEGLVMRPMTTMLDRSGKRIIAKIKHKDFK